MADDEKKARSIDDILDSVEKAQGLASNFVRSSFALGWDAYSKNVKITGINKETGELILEGDVATANAAARETIFENVLRNVYLPSTDDKAWKAILAEMNKPEHSVYKRQHLGMAFGKKGFEWESFWDSLTKPLDNFKYGEIIGDFMKGASGGAIGAIQDRYVTADEMEALVKEAEKRIAADPDWDLSPEWDKNPVGAAQTYLMMQRKMPDPAANQLAEMGYLVPKKKA